MSIAEKLKTIAENVTNVYNKGYYEGDKIGYENGHLEGYNLGKEEGYHEGQQAEYNAFWDAYQYSHGAPIPHNYTFAGWGWNDETFKPKYDIVIEIGSSGTCTFWGNETTNIAETLERQGVRLDTSRCGSCGQMFQNTKTKRLPELNFTHAQDYNVNGLYYTFTSSQVEAIDKIIVVENLKYEGTFSGCANLKNIVFEGVIGQAINFQWSTLLSHDSIVSVINNLSTDASGKTATFSATAVNNAFTGGSTGSEWQALIATKPNWTISLV